MHGGKDQGHIMTQSKATLYHTPLACSLAVRIAAAYGDVELCLILVDHCRTLSTDCADYKNINPLGQVATLITPTQEKITETSAALLWVQSQSANQQFCRTPYDEDYYQLIRWIGFTATEIHKQIYRMVFYDELNESSKDNIRSLAPDRFAWLNQHLSTRTFLLGTYFSAADAYLCWAMLLAERAGLDPSPYQHLMAYVHRLHSIPKVRDIIADDWEKKHREMSQ